MESLADLLKQLPVAATAQANRKKEEVLAHPLVAEFLAAHPELDAAAIRAGLPRLYQYATEADHCRSCPGLAACPNDWPGYYTRLDVQEASGRPHIVDYKVPCNKLLARQAEDEFKKRIRSFYIDESALAVTDSLKELKDFDKQRAKAVMQITKYIADTKTNGLQSHGLYLFGDFGTGKTHLMCHLLREMAKLGYHGVILYMPDFAEDLKSMFQEPQRLKDTIDLLKDADVLIFDDIGAENLNPWLRDHVLGAILNYRMKRKPTFYTSNYDLDRLAAHFSFTSKDGEDPDRSIRLMERIRPFVELVAVEGKNKRY